MRYLLYIFILFSLPIFGQNLNQIRPDTAAGSVPMTMAPTFRMQYVRPQTLADTLAPYLPSGHSPVTLSGPYDYITLSGQDIIRGQIDLTTDVTGRSLTLSGSDPVLTFDDTDLGGQDYSFRSDAGVFYLRNVTGASDQIYVDSDGRFGLGAMAPSEAKMFIYGGVSGANVDIRADDPGESSTLELQAHDYTTSFQTLYLQYVGSGIAGNIFGSIPNADLGQLAFGSENALIYTIYDKPLIFGTDFTERFRIDGTTGISTFLYDVVVPDEAYGVGWNGSFEVPTKNSLYDHIESLSFADSLGRNGTAGQIVVETATKAPYSTPLLRYENIFKVGYDHLDVVGIHPFTSIVSDTNEITSLHLENLDTGTVAEMRFVAKSKHDYLAFTTPSKNNTLNLFGISRGAGHFIFSSRSDVAINGISNRSLVLGNINNSSSAHLIFGTRNLERMRLTGDGSLGLRTTNPQQTFHVAGTMRLTGSDGTATNIMGRDADGDISAITVGTGLDLTAGTLTSTIIDTHIGNTDLVATGHRLIDFDNNSLNIFDISTLTFTSLGQFTITGSAGGSQIYATNAGVGITANGLRNITMDADSAVYISTWSGNIELASGEDFVIQTYGATLNDLRFDIDGGIFFVNELPELTTPTDTLLVRSGTGELMWMHAQALRQFGSTGEVGWADPLWDDNYGNYFVAVTQGSVSSPANGEVPVYNSSIFGFELRSLANEFNVTISNDTIFQNDNFIVLPEAADSVGTSGTANQVLVRSGGRGAYSDAQMTYTPGYGRLTVGSDILMGANVSTGASILYAGFDRTGDGASGINMYSNAGTGIDARVLRNAGTNGTYQMYNNGTGDMQFFQNSTGEISFYSSGLERFRVKNTGQLKAAYYGSGTFTGAPAYFPAFEADGDIIERTAAEVLTDIGAQPAGSYVSSNFTKTSSTTLSDVTGLTANVEAGQSYAFEAILYTTSNPASGVKAAIGGTATATSIIYEGNTMNANLLGGQTRATSLGSTVAAVTATSAAKIHITGTIVVNAGGTLTVQFAQNVSGGTGSVVLAGSSFEVIPVN